MAKDKNESKAAEKPEAKTKKEKFVELAEVRVPKALRQIAMIGNLSDKTKFEYSEKEVSQIHDALQAALDRMKARFENGEVKEEGFKLV